MSTPDITVVIPCYNAERWVGRAIDSVLAQEGVSVEVIVIDDGSTDRSIDVLRGYGDRISWETGPNRGACTARNRGLELARADHVMFLDADDYLGDGFLSSAISSIKETKADLVIGRCMARSPTGRTSEMRPPRTDDQSVFMADWLFGRWVPPCAVLWRKRTCTELGGWDESLRKHQDAEIMLRAAANECKLCSFDGAFSYYCSDSYYGRISQDMSEEALSSILKSKIKFLNMFDCIEKIDVNILLALGHSLHRLECRCAVLGFYELQSQIRHIRRNIGAPRYQGTFFHRLGCRFLGISGKEKLSHFLHSKGLLKNVR